MNPIVGKVMVIGADTASGTGLVMFSSVMCFLSVWRGYGYRSTRDLEMCIFS